MDLPKQEKKEKVPEGLGGMNLKPSTKKTKKKSASAAPPPNPFGGFGSMGGMGGMGGMYGGGLPGGAADPFADLMGGGAAGNPWAPPQLTPEQQAEQQRLFAKQMKEFETQMTQMFKDIPPPDPKSQEEQQKKMADTIAALSGQKKAAEEAAQVNDDGSTKSLNPEEAAMKEMFEKMASPTGMQEMMDNMLQHLLSKGSALRAHEGDRGEVPPWLKRNSKKIPDDELVRYEAQLVKVRAIIAAYEDDNTDFKHIVTLLQEMQSFGLPPDEIMKEMANKKGIPLGPGQGCDGMAPGLAGAGVAASGSAGAGPKGMGGSGLSTPKSGKGAGAPPEECVIM